MIKALLVSVVAMASTIAVAQTLPAFEDFKPGDKLTYNTKVGFKSSIYEFTFAEATPAIVKGVASIDGKQMEFQAPAHGYLGKEYCLADVMECDWTPPVKLFDKSIQVADKWTSTTLVSLQNKFLVDEVLESKADKFEKIKIAAGVFDAIKITSTGSIKSKSPKGETYSGSLRMTTWVGVSNNRLVMLKREYSNTFKQSFYQELAKVPDIVD